MTKDAKKDAILEAARERMAEAVDADQENRERGLSDLKFVTGEGQWPEKDKSEREADGRPCFTINRMPQFVRQVTGDIRRLNPAINILPASDDASAETAEVIEGLIRHIEYQSDASSVYEQTAESAAAGSIGWFRVMSEWADDASFDQEIRIKRIRNPFSVYVDPAAEDPTRSDAQFVFITEQMRQEDFKEAYPKASISDVEHDGTSDGLEYWRDDGKVIVAEYYWKEPIEKEIALLRNGEVVDEVTAAHDVVRTRKVQTHKLMWAKISGNDVLEGPTEQPSKSIPVFAVTGEEWHIGAEVYRSSVIRYAKDSQQIYNYMSSASAEFVAMQPKAPYMLSVKQVAGLESIWNEANTKNRPYLVYNPDEKAPPPQRATPPLSSQGIVNEAMKAAEDMKATTGIYDAGLGNQSNEKSGVAIRQRQMESDVATSIYSDNMAKAIAQCGRVIIEMIPKIYDTKRTLRILGKDDAEQLVQVNDIQFSMAGPVPVNDLTIGRYDVRVSVGPNYTTMRQEAAEGMLGFVQAFPAAANVTADLIAKSQDWPDADQFAERLKKILPPGVIPLEDMEPEQQQAAQAGMQQQAQQAQMMQQAQQVGLQKDMADAEEAAADAEKAKLEVAEKQLELAMKNGQLNEAIQAAVQEQVARVLQGTFGV